MAWAKTYTRTTDPKPWDSVLFCGICGLEVHVTRATDSEIRFTDPGAEEDAVAHLTEHHPWRYWLWKKLTWRWLIAGLAP